MIAMRSGWASASSFSLAPMCTSPPGEDDAADDLALLHHGVALGHARERQHGADERPDRAGGEEMQRNLDVLVGRVAGAGDADAPRDHETGVDLDALGADVAEHHDDRVLGDRAHTFTKRVGHDVLE